VNGGGSRETEAAAFARDEYLRRLFTPSFISSTLREYGLSLKKRFGQNLLINKNIAHRIIDYAGIKGEDVVLEIGPGLGALTFLLAQRAKQVIAVEIDGGIARYLGDAVRKLGYRNIIIVNRDFLGIDAAHFVRSPGKQPSGSEGVGDLIRPAKVVSNLPYSIGIKTILKTLSEIPTIESITCMVQRDIAERLAGGPGSKNYSAVSVIVQYLADIRVFVKSIAPGNFFPAPDVVSAVIQVKPKCDDSGVDRIAFEKIARAGFANRRKNLVGNLVTAGVIAERDRAFDFVMRRFQNPKIRAEKLSAADFVELTKALAEH
jgi:16S rRNA (adenine1518-N6/adenine1519-N6)-dimethyltransferase